MLQMELTRIPPVTSVDEPSTSSVSTSSQAVKQRSTLFSHYEKSSMVFSPRQEASKQLSDYIALINSPTFETKPLSQSLIKEFSLLGPLFARVFCVPASSAPVERVFVQSGIMMRPHRAKNVGPDFVNFGFFLKCNSHL
jgi:hypothetical protein